MSVKLPDPSRTGSGVRAPVLPTATGRRVMQRKLLRFEQTIQRRLRNKAQRVLHARARALPVIERQRAGSACRPPAVLDIRCPNFPRREPCDSCHRRDRAVVRTSYEDARSRVTSGGRVPGRWVDLRVRTVARLESL